MDTKHTPKGAISRQAAAMTGWIAAGLAGAWLVDRTLRRPQSLAGQTVLVTGGSRGLGLLLAQEFARRGCRIAICARDETELDEAHHYLRQTGADVFTFPCDVADQAAVERMIQAVTEHYGQLDILVNNAGVIRVGPYSDMKVQDFAHALEIMFWGMVYTTQAVLPQMQRRRYGRIVNITSLGGRVSIPHLLPYSSAKFAAVGFSEGLAAAVAQDGVFVTTVVPGLMRTGSHLQAQFKGRQEDEFTLFTAVSSLPGVSMAAESAARQIVEAVQRGDAECTLGVPALLLSLFHGLLPGPTVHLLSLVNRLLPGPNQQPNKIMRGAEVHDQLPEGRRQVLDTVSTLGQQAAERYQHMESATTEVKTP